MYQYLLFAFLFISCTQSGSDINELEWETPEVKGHWKLLDTEIVEEVAFLNLKAPEQDPMAAIAEDSPWDSYAARDLVFEQDSMYMIDYPIQTFTPVHYFLDTGYLHKSTTQGTYTFPAEMVNDTFYLYTPIPDYGFFKETFVPTAFNDSVLNVMRTYGINYPELAGTWDLVREDDYDYGTHYELNFPYTLPDSIEFTREQMVAALGNEKIYMMSTDGVKKDYSFTYRSSQIYFKPGKWCTDENAVIYFYKD